MPDETKNLTLPPADLAAFRYTSVAEKAPLTPLNLGGLRSSMAREPLSERLLKGLRFAVSLTPKPVAEPESSDGMHVLRYHLPLETYRATRRQQRYAMRRMALLGIAALSVPIVALSAWHGLSRPSGSRKVIQAPAVVAQAPAGMAQAQAPLAPGESGDAIYRVREGDTLSGIAHRHHVRIKALLAANDLAHGTRLKIGQELKFPSTVPAPLPAGTITTAAGLAAHEASGTSRAVPAQSVKIADSPSPRKTREVPRRKKRTLYQVQEGDTLSTVAERFGVKTAAIVEINDLNRHTVLRVGRKVLIPANVVVPDSSEHERTASHRERRKLANRGLLGDLGRIITKHFLWPTAGKISSYFGYRGEHHFHTGLDIPNHVGAAIRAAKPGVVVSAGWDGDYGRMVDVSHGNGVVTRYAHCSKLLVHPGEKVAQGETIALVGQTGHATGPHLHYEIRINGRPVDPLRFK